MWQPDVRLPLKPGEVRTVAVLDRGLAQTADRPSASTVAGVPGVLAGCRGPDQAALHEPREELRSQWHGVDLTVRTPHPHHHGRRHAG
eukprot:CAMPEP_0197927416 /NCGR_PEP_ID=MMETSP1439-20131203/100687_1 /TAXON_ID=66791 /ORGANISM="Gonyaulax spinifera, Strain CCMP409" /LENGTH=87 /DNA_ID=CAMNT_0043549987 /DNA_START=136 /DNA_END=395 /DNA_ORIENTATION=+